MKFIIERASSGIHSKLPPTENTIQEGLTQIDRRTAPIEKLDETVKEWFLSSGTNHHNEGNEAVRELEKRNFWTIEINSLDDLIQLYKKEGSIIFGNSYPEVKEDYLTLVIYDDYVE